MIAVTAKLRKSIGSNGELAPRMRTRRRVIRRLVKGRAGRFAAINRVVTTPVWQPGEFQVIRQLRSLGSHDSSHLHCVACTRSISAALISLASAAAHRVLCRQGQLAKVTVIVSNIRQFAQRIR
jgi:hypothetical protein